MAVQRSDVRSKLARQENAGQVAGEQCTSEYTSTINFGGVKKGDVLRCTRPASGHRVHQAKSVQW